MEENSKIKKIIICAIMIIIITSIIIAKTKNNNYEEIEYNEIVKISETTKDTKEKMKTIKIHITGEVKYNGIIELDEGSRIDDAIKTAGGLTENADISKVNLAYELSDGQKLYIPTVGVASQGDQQTEKATVEADASVCPQIITEQNGEGIIENNQNNNSKININTATQTEFETLPGIGPSLAYKIIKYREQNGKFKAIEDLKNVSGIGENKYKNIENFVEIK